MAFRRASGPVAPTDASSLTSGPHQHRLQLRGVALEVAGRHRDDARSGVASRNEKGDLRTLSVLTTWLGVHIAHVNVERLVRFVREEPSQRVQAYWSAMAHWLSADGRLGKLQLERDSRTAPDRHRLSTPAQGRRPTLRGLSLPSACGHVARPEDVPCAQE